MAMPEDAEARRLVDQFLSKSKPGTVRQLVAYAQSADPTVSEMRILKVVDALREVERISLNPPEFESFSRFFLDASWNSNFWTVFVVATASGFLSLSANRFPWSLSEILPGVLLIFYLPGRSFLRIFLRGERVQPVERLVLEIATSIVLVMLLGLLLNFGGLGLFSATALSSLMVFNLLLALSGAYSDYSAGRTA